VRWSSPTAEVTTAALGGERKARVWAGVDPLAALLKAHTCAEVTTPRLAHRRRWRHGPAGCLYAWPPAALIPEPGTSLSGPEAGGPNL
jgi:hypothetical protein